MTPPKTRSLGAADKLETMMNGSQPQANIFFQPDNLGVLPALWLQAKLFMTIAAELWLRGRIETLEAVFQAAARNFTIRLGAAAFSRCGNVFFPLRQLFGLQSWTFSVAGFFPASAGFFLASDGFFPASDGFFPLPPKCIFSAAKVLLCCCKVFFLLL